MTSECSDCEDNGLTELRDVRGRLLAVSYCSCARGEHLRIVDDFRAKRQIDETNAKLDRPTLAMLKRVRDGLLALPSGAGSVAA